MHLDLEFHRELFVRNIYPMPQNELIWPSVFLQTSTFDDPWQAIDIVQMLLRCLAHCIPLRLCWSCISGIGSWTPWLMFRALESLHSSSDENSGICVSKKCWRLIFFIVWTFSVFSFRCFDQKLNILPMHQSLILALVNIYWQNTLLKGTEGENDALVCLLGMQVTSCFFCFKWTWDRLSIWIIVFECCLYILPVVCFCCFLLLAVFWL